MLLRAQFKTETLDELDEVHQELVEALEYYEDNNPDTTTTIEVNPEEMEITIKVFKCENIN